MEEKCLSRCAAAYQYHQDGFNCAQSVVGAFQDLLGMDEKQAMAMAGGFGGGVGGAVWRRQRRRAGVRSFDASHG